MSLRALLYRRPTEPSALEIIFDKSVFLVRLRRHRQARRYTLRIDAALHEVVLTMPPRGSVREARDFAQTARRLDRGAAQAPAGGGAVRARRRGAAARHSAPHRASAQRARHGVDRDRRPRPAPALRRRRAAASRPPHRRLPQARGARAIWRRSATAMRPSSARRSSASRSGINRAAGAPAPTPGCCRSPGGSSWRPPSCSTIWRRTKSPISRSSTTRRASGSWSAALDADFERAKAWLDAHGTDLHRYGLAPKVRPAKRA